jgi:hypothetical protein
METLYEKASLILNPGVYDTSKVYATKPFDGSGDLTFTRSNDTATRVNSAGLIEKVRTNLALYSQNFSQTGTWVTSTTTRVDSQTDPNGGTTASKFTATGANSNVIQTLTVSSGIPYTWSFYAKSDSATDVNIRLDNNNGNFVQANMALTTSWQRFSITLNSNATTILCFIGGGISFTAGEVAYMAFAQLETGDIATEPILTTSAAVSVGPVANVPRLDYLGSSCPRLLLEPQTTALNQFSESFDNAYWQLKTDVTIEANTTDTLDPAGYYGAEKITETATTARHRVASNVTTLTTVNHTASVFMKKGTARYGFVTFAASTVYTIIVDLEDGTITATSTSGTIVAQKVEDYGNGWYRISVTGLSAVSGSPQYALQFGSAGSAVPSSYVSNIPSFTGSTSNYLYAWGANLTATSYLQSYVPTLGAAVTRGADVAVKTGISSLIGQPNGSVLLDFVYQNNFGNTRIFSISGASWITNGSIRLEKTGTKFRWNWTSGGSATGALTSTTDMVMGQRYKIAITYTATTASLFVNGVKENTASVTTPTGMLQVSLNELGGGFADANEFQSNSFNQVLLFKTALSDAEAIALTA